ncbi:MAG: penicillin-binding protein 1A [Atribacterota bacterium]|nr:penicillin-binding protein 1A [Atribacterota bacterium]MDD4896059.1 penicillin-binding protein 1A [Atribacterota bacterium]MDD5637021.1 penicillin-binding protein 1A [Atribacterota bacterium]
MNSRKKNKKSKNHSLFPKIFSLSLFLLILSFVLSLTFLISLSSQKMGEIVKSSNFMSPVTSKVYDINGKLITEFFQENRTPISLSEIPSNLINAFIAIEDTNFYKHHGISIRGIIRAMVENFKESGRFFQGQGGSTITQQLAVNTFLTREEKLSRKIKDALLALQIERTFTKDEILEMYLNLIYFGHGAHGIVSAATLYFDKPASELSLAESALIAGIPRRPYFYSPFINLEASLKRKNIILKRMFDLGYIKENEYLQAREEEIILNHNRDSQEIAPHFSSYIRTILLDKYGVNMVFKGGLKIYTTLDLSLQEKAKDAFLKSGREGALIAIEPYTGHIKAMVGGKNYEESEFNRATQAYRQPGSSFKTFVYLTAIEKRISPSLIMEDSPVVYENGWSPKNYEKEFRGPVTLREAFEDSINVIGVKLLERVGVRDVIQNAQKAGIKSTLRPDLSLALGTSEVTPLEMASAYATIANMGTYIEPTAIIKVEDYNGKILEQNQIIKKKVFSEDICYTLIKLMEGVIVRGTGFNARIGRPAAGKTGTTDEFIDAWFVGFTPELVCSVYIGNDDRKPLGNRITGGIVAAPIWHDFMANSLQDKPISEFPRPKNVTEMLVCAKTGLIPSNKCANTVSVTFLSGTEPTQTCYEGAGLLPEYVVESSPPVEEVPVISGEKNFPLLEEIEILQKDGMDDGITKPEETKKETLQSLVNELRKRLEQRSKD